MITLSVTLFRIILHISASFKRSISVKYCTEWLLNVINLQVSKSSARELD